MHELCCFYLYPHMHTPYFIPRSQHIHTDIDTNKQTMSPSPSTRWSPTPEQLMILEELYRRGVRTPNASQIQKITAHLAFYGKIQGKNVFYWFQNHKARDRQKMRKKIAKQLHQQHLLYPAAFYHQQPQLNCQMYPFNLHYFHASPPPPPPPPPPTFLHHLSTHSNYSAETLLPQAITEPCEEASKHEKWRMDLPKDWKIGILEEGPASFPCCSKRPLQTLELFPLRSDHSAKSRAI